MDQVEFDPADTWNLKTFNQLSVDDLYQILQLRCQVFVLEQACPYLDIDSKDQEAFHLYYKESDQVVGYCRILPPGLSFQEASIGRFLVAESHRKKGLGQKILARAIEYCWQVRDYDCLKISAQTYLLGFYQSFGFECVSAPYLEDGIEHVDMVLMRGSVSL